ncbi:MAG TPA: helix-turn-helix transcriptional regulator [Mycobacteriales bacterium]|nr:helix-turn-helix transcriptional regulator [Mycobacteriales bacterium]
MPTTTSRPRRVSAPPQRVSTLLRGHIGAALRRRREAQQRTLRDVAATAGVSLGYLSEVERGVKEPSSELLSAICRALEARLPDVLVEVADALYRLEVTSTGVPSVLAVGVVPAPAAPSYDQALQSPEGPSCGSARAA